MTTVTAHSQNTASQLAQNNTEMIPGSALKNSEDTGAVKRLTPRSFIESILTQLDELAHECQQWEGTHFKTASQALYHLLAKCLAIYNVQFLNASQSQRVELRQEIARLLRQRNIRVGDRSSTLTMLVRYIFSSDRKRAHGYQYVLAAAISYGINAADLPSWIVDQGGIEQIKRKVEVSAATAAQRVKVDQANEIIVQEIQQAVVRPLAVVPPMGLKGSFALLLVKPDVSGGASVIGKLSDVSDLFVSGLYRRMAKNRVADGHAGDLTNKEVNRIMASQGGRDQQAFHA